VSLLVVALTLLLGLVVLVLSAPLRAARREAERGDADAAPSGGASEVSSQEAHRDTLQAREELRSRGELEAEREAKYREIRDAELDYRTGKLSRTDYEAIDAELRREALEILNRIEAAEEAGPESP